MKKILFALITTFLIVGCTPKIYRSMGMRPTISVSTYRSNLMPVFDSLAAPLYFTADVTFKENNVARLVSRPYRDEGPQVAMTGEARGCSRAVAPVCGFSRGTTARSVSLSWGAKEVGSPCEWRGGARHCSQVIVGESGLETC